MKPSWPTILVALLLPCVAGAEIYRSVDQHGNVIYSDQPGTDSKKVDLPALSTYKAPPVAPDVLKPTTKAGQGVASTSNLSFVQPGADETVFDNQGNVAVALRVEPPLQPNQRLALQLDDAAAVESQQPTYEFKGVNRGTHTVRAWIVGPDGQAAGERAEVTFHLRQASRLFREPAPRNGAVQRAPRAPTAPNVPSPGGS